MSFAKVYSAQTILLDAKIITIEADITKKTLNAITIVGLPDKGVGGVRETDGYRPAQPAGELPGDDPWRYYRRRARHRPAPCPYGLRPVPGLQRARCQ